MTEYEKDINFERRMKEKKLGRQMITTDIIFKFLNIKTDLKDRREIHKQEVSIWDIAILLPYLG